MTQAITGTETPPLRPPDLEPPPVEPEEKKDEGGGEPPPVYHLVSAEDPHRAICGVRLQDGGRGYRGFSENPCSCCVRKKMEGGGK